MTPDPTLPRHGLLSGMARTAILGMFDDGATDLKARLVGIPGGAL